MTIGNFSASKLQWRADGLAVVLLDREMFCVGYLVDEMSI